MKGFNEESTRRTHSFGPLVRFSAVAAASLIGSGCYTYTPMSHELVPVGEEVRVVVTRTGVGALADEMRLTEAAPVLIGRVSGREPGVLLLRVPQASDLSMAASGVEMAQIARLSVGDVLSLERRELSAGRTAAALGAVVGATTFLVLGIIEASGSDSGGGDDGIVLAISGLRIPFR